MERPQSRNAKPGSHPQVQAERREAITKLFKNTQPTTHDYAEVCARLLPVEGLASWLLETPPGQQYQLGWLILESSPDEAERERYAQHLYDGQSALAIERGREQSESVLDEYVLQQAFRVHVTIVRDYVRRLIQASLEDGLFRIANKRLGYGLETAYQKAEAGDQEALCAIVGTFPLAQFNQDKPWIQERLRTLLSTDAGFERNYRRALRETPGHEGTKADSCLFLALHRDIVRAMMQGTLSAPDTLAMLASQGFPEDMTPKSFAQYVRRTFPDLIPPKPAGAA